MKEALFSVKNARETSAESETEEDMNHSRSMGRNHPFQFSIEEERAQCRCPLYRVVQQDLTLRR